MRFTATMRTLLVTTVLLGLSGPGLAQPVLEIEEEVDFDRPEAWAMKFFTSATLLTSLTPPKARTPGSVEIGLEVGNLPHLDKDERTVGFNGTKEEDLNKLPVLVRPRVTIGLPKKLSLDVSYLPPLEIEGLEPNLLSLALGRPVLETGPWSLGLRLWGQVGDIQGDFTCTDEDAAFPPGSPENRFGCEARSDDRVELQYVGLELTGAYQLQKLRRSTLLFSASANYFDLEFQVDAQTFGFKDRTKLLADGWTYALGAGISIPVQNKTSVGVALFYSPLDVQRQGASSSETDAFFNVRALVGYAIK